MTRSAMWSRVGMAWLVCSTGCFGTQAELPGANEERLEKLGVSDSQGAPWEASEAPRRPVLRLAFDRPPSRVAERLWLVHGAASDDLLDDLGDPPLRLATQHALVPLEVTEDQGGLQARPTATLSRGSRYTLVWTGGPDGAQRFPLRVSESPAAGAELAESWPGDHDVRVPPNTDRLLLRFDGYVRGLSAESVGLVERGKALEATVTPFACDTLGLPVGDCAHVMPQRPLQPDQAYELVLGETLRDATGASLPPRRVPFSTSALADDRSPRVQPTECALDELPVEVGCVLATRDGFVVRGSVDEPALVTLSAAGTERAALARLGGFELALSGVSGAALFARLAVTDQVGHTSDYAFAAHSAEGLASLRIDEIRPDPLGPEPAQEFVELLNFGPEPIQIMDFSLTDNPLAAGRRVITPCAVAKGERVLLVGPGFDPLDPADGALPAGVRLVHLDGPLSLRNDGEALYLRDERGRRVASVERQAPDAPGQCLGHLPDDEPHRLSPDPLGGCTPGTETREAPR